MTYHHRTASHERYRDTERWICRWSPSSSNDPPRIRTPARAGPAQEVDDLGLTVAGPDAYPWLHVVEGPGRSLSHRRSDRLLRTLQALIRIGERSVEGGLKVDHRCIDEETGIAFTRCLLA